MFYPFVIFNNQLIESNYYQPIKGDTVLYEVIRVSNGIFLFLDDHVARLQHSAQLAGVGLPIPISSIYSQLSELLQANHVQNGNIRLEFHYRQKKVEHYTFFFIPHRYPPDELYQTGIRTTLFIAKRTNPNAKIQHPSLTEEINQILAEKQVYEVILTHPDGYITEGSRSNFFMVKEGTVYTAPEADVLPGITRKYVLQICRDLSIPLVEERIQIPQLKWMAAAFISGTSPKVLPVSQVDEYFFDPSEAAVHRIMKRYDEIAGL